MNRAREKYFFCILLVLAAALSLAIVWPFLTVIFLGAAFAVALEPVRSWLHKRVAGGRSWLSALLTVLVFIFVIGAPLFFIGSQVILESRSLYYSILDGGSASDYARKLALAIEEVLPEGIEVNLPQKINELASFVAGSLTQIFTSTLHTGLSIILILLSIFYFLKDGAFWKKHIVEPSPLSDTHDERILSMLARAVNGVMRGYILMALIQGALISFGLLVFRVPNAFLWGVVAAIASMIPSIGTAIVSIPAILYLFYAGSTGAALGLLAWSVVLVGMADNVLSPIIVGKRVELPPIMILFAVLGGIALMGVAGIIIGPLVLTFFHTLTLIYKEHFQID